MRLFLWLFLFARRFFFCEMLVYFNLYYSMFVVVFLFLAAFLLNDAAKVHEDILSLVSVGHYF